GLGQDHGPLAVGLGADLLRGLLALGSQPAGNLLALGPHPPVHVGDHLAVGRQVDPLDPQVDDADADGGRALVDLLQLLGEQLVAGAGHDLGQGARVDLVAQRVLDERRQALHRDRLVATGGAVERAHLLDHAYREAVHGDVLALGGQVALRFGVEHLQAAVELERLLDHRDLEVQAGPGGALDATELQDHRGLALAHHVDRAEQHEDRGDGDCNPYSAAVHRDGSWLVRGWRGGRGWSSMAAGLEDGVAISMGTTGGALVPPAWLPSAPAMGT